MSKMEVVTKKRSFWGWGWEGHQLDDSVLEKVAGVSGMLGLSLTVDDIKKANSPKIEAIKLPKPQFDLPPNLRHIGT